jgi:hypothetical protein
MYFDFLVLLFSNTFVILIEWSGKQTECKKKEKNMEIRILRVKNHTNKKVKNFHGDKVWASTLSYKIFNRVRSFIYSIETKHPSIVNTIDIVNGVFAVEWKGKNIGFRVDDIVQLGGINSPYYTDVYFEVCGLYRRRYGGGFGFGG